MNRLAWLAVLSMAACTPSDSVREDARARFLEIEQAWAAGQLGTAGRLLDTIPTDAAPGLRRQALFLQGNLRFAQAEVRRERARAALGRAEDWQQAVQLARGAQQVWRQARGARRDWPAARRNVERAELWIADLLDEAGQAGVDLGEAATAADTTSEPAPEPPPPTGAEQSPPVPPPPTPERIDALLERMAEQQAEQRSARRAQPGLDIPEVERDW